MKGSTWPKSSDTCPTCREERRRADRAARALAKDGADTHLIEAMERAERELEATINIFFKSTYFHAPQDQPTLSDS